MQEFLSALRFLTRIPSGKNTRHSPELLGSAVSWYPVVGLVIGSILLVTAWALHDILGIWPSVSAVLVTIIWVAVTGAIHLDGLADCADAVIGGHSPQRKLEIMKDTNCGVGAVAAVVLILLLKVSAITVLIAQQAWFLLLVAPLVARIVLVGCIATIPYIRDGGLGAGLQSNLDTRELVIISGLCAILVVIISAAVFLVSIAAGALAFLIILWTIVRPVNGATGDVYGALVEMGEALVLVGLVSVI